MANYFVSYDLNGVRPSHAEIDAHIAKNNWKYGRVLESVWYISTALTQVQVFNYINTILSPNDRLLVISANDAHFRNLLVSNVELQGAWGSNT